MFLVIFFRVAAAASTAVIPDVFAASFLASAAAAAFIAADNDANLSSAVPILVAAVPAAVGKKVLPLFVFF